MAKYLLSLGLVAMSLSGCTTPLTEPQKIDGSYLCRATKDQMIFTPDGEYHYSIGGSAPMWHGNYCYDPSPEVLVELDAYSMTLARQQYNRRGKGLRFTYALSGHCYPDGKPLWGNPYFTTSDKKRLIVTSLGKERSYIRQEKKQVDQRLAPNR